jgi:hypothetical protein
MEEPVKLAIVTAVLMMAVTIFFKNIVHEPQDVVSLSSINFLRNYKFSIFPPITNIPSLT